MQQVLVVKNRMPLSLRGSFAKEDVATLTYIPGTVVLGGLAAAHHRLGRDAPEFADFFLSQKVSFGNLYPANFKQRDFKPETRPMAPLPMTARSCKRFKGFRFQSDDDKERHGVVDQLIPWSVFALSGQRAVDVLGADVHRLCGEPGCELERDRFDEGFYRQGRTPEAWGCSDILRRLITRSGVNRQRGAVHEGILYNREVLAEHQTFWGTVESDDADLLTEVTTFIKDASAQELLYVGNNKSRGFGKVSVTVRKPFVPPDTVETLAERVRGFTDRLKTEAGKYGVPADDDLYIPVTLHSDMILRDALLRYQSDLRPADMQIQGLTPVYQATDQRPFLGWNRFLGLPKTRQQAIMMGSVFLFGYSGPADAALWQKLLQVQTQGIGERRAEGFGTVRIADPFHFMEEPR